MSILNAVSIGAEICKTQTIKYFLHMFLVSHYFLEKGLKLGVRLDFVYVKI